MDKKLESPKNSKDKEEIASHIDINRRKLDGSQTSRSFNQEIFQLEKKMKDQLLEGCILERGLGSRSSVTESSYGSSMPKSTEELIREIALLDLEVTRLEKYLLILYRKALKEQQIANLSPVTQGRERINQHPSTKASIFQEAVTQNGSNKKGKSFPHSDPLSMPQRQTVKTFDESCPVVHREKLNSVGDHRTHSSLSYRSICSTRMSPSSDPLHKAIQSCHSQPLSFEDPGNASSGVISLADYLGANIADLVPETPNKISEDMVNCMASIYCKLSEPPLTQNSIPSPTSSYSSMSALSPLCMGDVWSPCCRKESTLDSRLINPFHIEGLKDFSGPYNFMAEVPSLCRGREKMQDVEHLLQKFELLLDRLKTADPRKLEDKEKLAFWVNVHNALMMHVYLRVDPLQHNKKRPFLLSNAKCVIGGKSINVDVIQSSILRCRTHCSVPGIRMYIYRSMKYISRDEWKAYAISHPEPLLHFTLCSGSHSDPAVRVYTPRKVFEQMEAAKEEYIRATVAIWEEQMILVPKLINCYSKDKGLSMQNVVDMIQCYLPDSLGMAMQRCKRGGPRKIIQWVPPNFTFRYLLSRELVNFHMR